MCTDKLILATGATALEHIDWSDRNHNSDIKQKMESTIIDIPAVKVSYTNLNTTKLLYVFIKCNGCFSSKLLYGDCNIP